MANTDLKRWTSQLSSQLAHRNLEETFRLHQNYVRYMQSLRYYPTNGVDLAFLLVQGSLRLKYRRTKDVMSRRKYKKQYLKHVKTWYEHHSYALRSIHALPNGIYNLLNNEEYNTFHQHHWVACTMGSKLQAESMTRHSNRVPDDMTVIGSRETFLSGTCTMYKSNYCCR